MKKLFTILLIFLFPFILLAQVVYPMDGSPVNDCTGTFSDSGGLSGDYSPNENLTTIICPTTSNEVITLSFQNSLLGSGDTLCFFDGNTVAAPLLLCINESSGNNYSVQGSSLNTSGCITVTFKSDASNETAGWAGVISCMTPCQEFEAQIFSSVPPVFPIDTGYIDLCIGDTVFLSGTADFYQNNINYLQEDDSSIFEWRMGDGTTLYGKDVSHIYQQPGGYYAKLRVTDVNNCTSENLLTQRIRVTGLDQFNIQTDHEAGTCEGDTVTLISNPIISNSFLLSDILENTNTLSIPDGNGVAYTTSILIDQFPVGSSINNTSGLVQICMNMEHSYLGDLNIELICPSGNTVALQTQSGAGTYLGEPIDLDFVLDPGIGYDYCFSDNAVSGTFSEYLNATPSPTLPAGLYNPVENFSTLIGCPLNGEWSLRITDNLALDNGFLFSWSLEFEEGVPGGEIFTVDITNQEWLASPAILSNIEDTIVAQITGNESFTYQIDFENGCSVDTTLSISPISNNTLACSDCDDLVSDAGADVSFDCSSPLIYLNAENSSTGDYFEYEWTTSDGQFQGATNETTATVTDPGTYVFTLTSLLTGCTVSDSVLVSSTMNTPIANAGEDIPFPCNATEVTLNGTGSTVGIDFVFQWTAVNGQIASGANSLTPVVLEPGIYVLQVDNTTNGCLSLDTVSVLNNAISGIAVTEATCDNDDGSITISVPLGTNNPVFTWSNGQVGAVAQNLSQGWYSITVTYDTDCFEEQNIYVDEELSCKVQIIGRVINDNILPDCIEDGSSNYEGEIMLHLMPEDVYTYTNAFGFYQFVTDNGDHTIEIITPSYLESLCPVDNVLSLSIPTNGTVSSGNDFYLTYAPGSFDLSVSCYMGIARVGMDHVYNIEYCNEGAIPKSGTITFIHDDLENNIFTNPLPQGWIYDEATSTATWTFTDLQPGSCLTQQLILEIPVTASAGDILSGSLEISSDGDDFDPTNNLKSWNQTVVASFDPNDKQVFTVSSENQFGGMIYETDTTLFYQIRFQNTGTDTAFSVVIRDTLDVAALDIRSIHPSISSHSYELAFEGNNVLVFNFENIMLPDSNTNLAGSQGYVTFSIDRKLNLPLGTTISNSAAIYFDYNSPVITNEVINILSEIVSVNDFEERKPVVQISPNPNTGVFSVFYTLKKSDEVHFSIFDLYGNTIVDFGEKEYQNTGSYQKNFSIKHLPAGVYFLQLRTQGERVVKRMVKVE